MIRRKPLVVAAPVQTHPSQYNSGMFASRASGRALLWLVATAALVGACKWSTAPHHVLIVTLDTLRADRVGAYGYRRRATPVLDGAGARGAGSRRPRRRYR